MGLPPSRKSKMYDFFKLAPKSEHGLKTKNIMQVTFVKKLKLRTISTEIDWKLKYAIFSTACSIVYKYCTVYTTNQQTSVFMGIFKNPLDTKHKISNNRLNS